MSTVPTAKARVINKMSVGQPAHPNQILLTVLRARAGRSRQPRGRPTKSASLIGRLGSSAFRLSTNSGVDVAHGLSLLFGLGTKGPSIMGFEVEVEQSFGRPCRQCDCRFKRTYELTSSIVPRGTSFHRSVELECPYWIRCCRVFMLLLLLWPVLGSSGTRVSPNTAPTALDFRKRAGTSTVAR